MEKSKIGIIIGREYAVRVKKKSFIITTILTPLLFAVLLLIPYFIALYPGYKREYTIKVVDNSGIVMPYLESNSEFLFEPAAEDESIDELKQKFSNSNLFAVLKITALDSNMNLSITGYSEKQMGINLQNFIQECANRAVEENKLKAYNIPDLEEILRGIESDVKMQTFTLDEETGEEKVSVVEINMGIGYLASFLIYMFIFMFGSMVMRSVIEEKTTRIVEVIVSSVKPFQLMMGKIIGVAAVGLTQFLIWILLTFAIITGVSSISGALYERPAVGISAGQVISAMEATGAEASQMVCASGAADLLAMTENMQQDVDSQGIIAVLNAFEEIDYVTIIICFLIYFLLGYLLYSGMFAAVGSAVDNEADTQQLILPVTMPLIIGLFIMLHTFQYPDSSLSFWASIIPFTSPMVMMARIAYGVSVWELALSIGLLIIAFVFFTYISGKIYRVGILMYGKKATWKDLWKWLKVK